MRAGVGAFVWGFGCGILGALPGLGAAWLRLAPGRSVWLGLSGMIAGVIWIRAVRRPPTRHRLATPALILGASAGAVVGLAALLAAWNTAIPPRVEARAAAIYALDAAVVTQPLPRCRTSAVSMTPLLDRGAHPRLDASGAFLWFDANAGDGRRQVYRFDRKSEEVVCWTCQEPGSNRRPDPGGAGRSVVYDSDRHASALEPTNTELFLSSALGDGPRHQGRRLTFRPGPDDHPLMGATGVILWSRGAEGSFDVVSASLATGHGGMLLGVPARVVRGGARWVAPVAWSPDARALVVASGQPLGPLRAVQIDLATESRVDLTAHLAPGSASSFSADGGWMAIAEVDGDDAASRIPASLGFLLGHLRPWLGEANRFTGGRIQAGETGRPENGVALGEDADWGGPTGVALERDGMGVILGQRRQGSREIEERLIQVSFDCQQ